MTMLNLILGFGKPKPKLMFHEMIALQKNDTNLNTPKNHLWALAIICVEKYED